MISILNYGVGNIKAFANAFNRLGIEFKIASNKNELENSEKILFPGVGSFDNAMFLLNKSGMRDELEFLVIEKNVPILGVCVGMQMFADKSEEGNIKGLGWINASVERFSEKHTIKVPHMGWNNVDPISNHPILNGITNESYFYFLHSYYFNCKDNVDIAASSFYGSKFTSIVIHDNIIGVQFHPEKSHEDGLKILENFNKI